MNAEDYLTQLQALLPPGAAWTRDPDATLTRLLHAFADGLARIDARATDLLREADPREALELIPEWLAAFGLPDECTDAASLETLAGQRAALLARVTQQGGATAAYLIGLAADIGFEITITEIRPSVCGVMVCGDELIPGEAIFSFEVNAPATSVIEAECGNMQCGDPLGYIEPNEVLECVIRRYMPAHLVPIFLYGV